MLCALIFSPVFDFAMKRCIIARDFGKDLEKWLGMDRRGATASRVERREGGLD
jgi:hypothetical protein